MKKALIYYRYFGFSLGGGELLPLALVAELQKTCDVTLALDWTDHFERAVGLLGVPIDLERLHVVKIMPKNFHATQTTPWQSFQRFHRLRHLAKAADICISLANVMDFGKPAHHFLLCLDIGDSGFARYAAKAGPAPLKERIKGFISSRILRPLLGMRTKESLICDARQRIYPNSQFMASLLEGYYGVFKGEVFYPPTLFTPCADDAERDDLRVVYIGRITCDKGVKDIVEIVEKARKISGLDLKLAFAGRLDDNFGRRFAEFCSKKEWIEFAGELFGDAKARFLASGTFAIHAMRIEAFGISITEYLKAGIIPIVPDEGGSCEVVGNPALTYTNNEHAASILARLASDGAFREEQKLLCAERAKLFTREAYLERQRHIVERILASK